MVVVVALVIHEDVVVVVVAVVALVVEVVGRGGVGNSGGNSSSSSSSISKAIVKIRLLQAVAAVVVEQKCWNKVARAVEEAGRHVIIIWLLYFLVTICYICVDGFCSKFHLLLHLSATRKL